MASRSVSAALSGLLVVSAGCVTTTAHRLVLIDNPLRQQAEACETKCRGAATRPGQDCPPFGGARCGDGAASVDDDSYATCLDNCPGTRATDGTSCPHPDPGAICVETTKANAGGIAGGVVAALAIGLLIVGLVVLGEILSAPILVL